MNPDPSTMGPIESEFDPTIYTAEFVTAERDEPLEVVLQKVEAALDRTPNTVLIIPRGSRAFHATQDFLALGRLHGGQEVRVAIASTDPTVASLARVLGFHVEEVPYDHPFLEEDQAERDAASIDTEQPTSPLPLRPNGDVPQWVLSQPDYKYPASTLTTSAWLNHPGEQAQDPPRAAIPAHAVQPIGGLRYPSQQLARPGVPLPRTRPRQTGRLQPAIITDPSLPAITSDRFTPVTPLVSTTASGRIKARRVDDPALAYLKLGEQEAVRTIKRGTWRRVVAGALLALLLALAGGAYYAYTYLPEATVAVTPLQLPINKLAIQVPVLISPGGATHTGLSSPDLQTSISSPGGPLITRSVNAVQVAAPIVEEATAPSTGTRQVAKGRGTGMMHFINHTNNPVTIPQGLQFKSPNGVPVQVTQGGVLPPTDFFNGRVSSIDLPIAATVDGPTGNVGSGQLRGVAKDGTYEYVNNAALEGGSLQTIKVVTQADIDNLTKDLTAKVEDPDRRMGLMVAEVAKTGADEELITQTVRLLPAKVERDHEAGQDGEAVHVKVSTQVQAYAVSRGQLTEAVQQAVVDYVPQNVPSAVAPNLDLSSVHFAPPGVASIDVAGGRITYATSASARVNYSLTPTLKSQIRDLVTGKSVAQARSLIAQQYGAYVSPATIQAKVLWLTVDKMPTDPNRITVGQEGIINTGGNGGGNAQNPQGQLPAPSSPGSDTGDPSGRR